MPSAGKGIGPHDPDGVVLPTPRTPNGLTDTRLRHRHRTGPGEMSVHWGLKGVPFPEPGAGYGRKCPKGEDVAHNIRAAQKVGVAEYLAMRGEAIYFSTTREPLGKGYVRGHSLPGGPKDPDFPGFGAATHRDMPAKEVIFPRNVQPDSETAKAQYRRTHASYDAGEMATRNYNWPTEVDGNPLHRFGAEEKFKDSNPRGIGVKAALTMDCGVDDRIAPATKVGNLTLEHFRIVTSDHLGKSKNLMQQGQRELPKEHVFGIQTGADQCTAGDLVRGFYSREEQLPDPDLGRCTARGRRNYFTQEPFGIPTVRTDLPAPPLPKRSVANCTNYGDDADALRLICPGRYQAQGVFDSDFQVRRSGADTRALLRGAGMELDDARFEEVFQAACGLHGDGGSTASLEAVSYAYAELVTLRK